MDLSIDAYEKLIEAYKTTKEIAGKVSQIFSQGRSEFSDPEYEVVVAGFMQNQALEGMFERVKLGELGLKVMPTDQKSLAIALLTKRGYDIVATDKDLAGDVMDIIARKPESGEVVVMKCGPAFPKKMLGYLERPGTEMWILDPQYRLFMFRRGQNWDSFMAYHKEQQEGPQEAAPGTGPEPEPQPEPAPEPEPQPVSDEPEIRPVETFETQTAADVIAQAESAGKAPEPEAPETSAVQTDLQRHDMEVPEPEIERSSLIHEPEEKPAPEPEIRVEEPGESPEDDDEGSDEAETEDERAQHGAVFTVGNRKLPRILHKEEVAEMLRISRPVQRDSILLQCMYFLGMTNSEVQNLRVEDIDFASGKIKISEGKNRRDRILPVPAELSQALKAFMGARDSGYVIRGRDKKAKRISDRHIRRLVKAYAKEANVRNWEDIHPHTLRHSYATHLLDEGTPIETVQGILGHERLETTAIYSHARNTRELQEQVNGALS
jgi:hypothetical protein